MEIATVARAPRDIATTISSRSIKGLAPIVYLTKTEVHTGVSPPKKKRPSYASTITGNDGRGVSIIQIFCSGPINYEYMLNADVMLIVREVYQFIP
ncbi:hypothetical protein TWF103_002552 [Orbilia oligospora]|nr:hypothetical protein TWF103_002552 [Orbilia oligospora]